MLFNGCLNSLANPYSNFSNFIHFYILMIFRVLAANSVICLYYMRLSQKNDITSKFTAVWKSYIAQFFLINDN